MFDLFRLSSKINRILGIFIIFLGVLSMIFPEKIPVLQHYTSVVVTFILGALSFSTGFIAKLKLMVISEEIDFDYQKVRNVCWGLSITTFVLSCIGLAIGISTGNISYIYILLIPAMALYLICMFSTRIPKEEDEITF